MCGHCCRGRSAPGGNIFLSALCREQVLVCITAWLTHKEPLIQPRTITDRLNDSHANDSHKLGFHQTRGPGDAQERGPEALTAVAEAASAPRGACACVRACVCVRACACARVSVRVGGVEGGGLETSGSQPSRTPPQQRPANAADTPTRGNGVPVHTRLLRFPDAESLSGRSGCQSFPNFPKLPLPFGHPLPTAPPSSTAPGPPPGDSSLEGLCPGGLPPRTGLTSATLPPTPAPQDWRRRGEGRRAPRRPEEEVVDRSLTRRRLSASGRSAAPARPRASRVCVRGQQSRARRPPRGRRGDSAVDVRSRPLRFRRRGLRRGEGRAEAGGGSRIRERGG